MELYGRFLFLFVVLFLFFCCLGSVFAIDNSDSVYVPDEMGAGSISSSLNVDCNGNVEIDDDYVDKLYLKSDIPSNNESDKEDVLTNSSSPRRYVSDVPVVNKSSVVDGGSVSTKGTKTKTKIVASNLNMDYYDGSKLIAYIKTTSNTPIKGVKVTFKVNGKTYNRTSDSNGKVVLGITNGITLYPGSYSCLIKFAGNSAYAASNKTVTITVKKWNTKIVANNLACYYNDSINLVATLQNSSSKAIKGKSLSFIINGVTYSRTTDSSGKATLSLPNLNPGSYSCLIKFAGDKVNASCNKTVTVTVNKWSTQISASDLACYYNDSIELIATLKNNYNSPLSNKLICFVLNGVNYSCTTDSNGVASLPLPNLNPGSYSCTINFIGEGFSSSSSKTVNVTVNKIPTSLYAYGLNLTYGEDNKIFVKVKDYKDNILENKRVYLILNHAPHGVTDEEGRIGVIAYPPGVWNCFYSFFGDEYYESSSLTVTYSIGVASPIVNYDSGIYNDSNLTVSISSLHGETIFYSWDNGISWNESLENVSCNLAEGNWTLKAYNSLNDCNSSIIERNFLVGNFPPNVWASYGSGIYDESFNVELFAEDNNDDCPLIYYTCDGSLPTTDSSVYSAPIPISNGSNVTNLRFFAIDKYGAYSDFVSVYYFFGDLVANLNNGKVFNSVQDAIDDNDTSIGDIIGIGTDFDECFVLNKNINLKKNTPILLDDSLTNLGYFYNGSNMLINFSSSLEDSIVFCSFDNGSSWKSENNSICFNLVEGNWSIWYYCSLNGINSSIYELNFLVDCTAPLVWASNGSSIYNESLYVNLSAFDYVDDCPLIYYTCDGSLPTGNSSIYYEPIYVSNSSNVTHLRFFAIDKVGHRSKIVSVYYFFGDLVANLNNGKVFNSVQDAIDDNDTVRGDVIEVSRDLDESLVLDKGVYLRACDFKSITWNSSGSAIVVNDNGSIIEGFNFISPLGIDLNGASDSFILNNIFNCSYADIFNFNGFVGGNNQTIHSANNIILDNSFVGFKELSSIYLNSFNSTFVGNHFNLTWNSSALCLFSTFSLISDNHFYNCGYGLSIYGFNFTVSNNVFMENIYGIYFIDLFNETMVEDVNGGYISSLYSWSYGDCGNDIFSNSFLNNDYAVFVESGYGVKVNFNSIVNSSVCACSGILDAQYNWWGTNDESAVLSNGNFSIDYGGVIVVPYLVLSTYVSSYKISNGTVFGAKVCADLNTVHIVGDNLYFVDYYNNLEIYGSELFDDYYHISSMSSVPDGLIVNFNNDSFGSMVDGVAYGDVVLGSDGVVCVSLDDCSSLLSVERDSMAHIVISSPAFVHGSNETLFYDFYLPLNDSVDWFTCVWRYKDVFESEVDLLVNGEVVESFVVDCSFYRESLSNVSDIVLNATALYNDFLYNKLSYRIKFVYALISLDYNLTDLDSVKTKYLSQTWRDYPSDLAEELLTSHNVTVNEVLLSLIKNSYGLSDEDIDFIGSNHDNFRDDIFVSVDYLGDSIESFNFDVGNISESFIWHGDYTARHGLISYVNGAYAHEVGSNSSEYFDIWKDIHLENGTVEWNYQNFYGYYSEAWYDGLMTFTFANTRIDNDILAFWLGQKNRTYDNGSLYYDNGFMKAAYGSFLEGLLVIYCNDLVADGAAERFNVSWERTSPMVMSVRDDNVRTIMSGESSFYFGRTAYGDLDAVKAFYFACSASFSPIEHYVGTALFPRNSDNCSVTTGLGFILNNGGTIEIVQEGNFTLIREAGSNEKVLVFDASTGLLHDQMQVIYGAFCYSNQQTDWAYDLGSELLNNFGPIWDYLCSNGDLPSLSLPATNFLKSANLFLGFGSLFVVEGAELTGTLTGIGGLVGGLTMGGLVTACIIVLPVLFVSIEPVGGPNENEEISEFYESHNYDENSDINQIKSSKDWVKELKKIQKGEDIPKNGDLNYLDGTDGDPENLIKALVIISSFTGLSIIGDVYINNGHKDYENIANLNSTYSNFTLDVNYNKSDSKITLTRV